MNYSPDDLMRTVERAARRWRERDYDALSTQDAYDRWAEIYDDRDNPLIAHEERELPEVLGDVSGLDALDVGCGTGRWTEKLVTGGARVTALDFSAGMLARAAQRPGAAKATFVRHDLAAPLPFAEDSFDLALSALVIEHVRELDLLFGELARVCRPGGRVVLSAMHPALMLLGVQAEFPNPETDRDTRPQSYPHQICDFVMAATRAGLTLEHLGEHEVDDDLQKRSPNSGKWAGWPFLLLLSFRA